MSLEDENKLSHYQMVLLQDNHQRTTNVIRKHLIIKYLSSSKQLKNEDTLHLLNKDLKKYVNVSASTNQQQFNTSKNEQWHSSLDNVNLNSILPTFACSNSIQCKSVENISQDLLKNLLPTFNSNFENKSDFNNEFKTRRIAKSFAPQCCTTKDRKHFKVLSQEDNTISVVPKVTDEQKVNTSIFKTAREELDLQNTKKFRSNSQTNIQQPSIGQKRKLGTRRNVQNKFVSPMLSNNSGEELSPKCTEWSSEENVDERLKNIDPKMVELIRSEIMDCSTHTDWNDIAGLEFAKSAIQEAVIWPLLRPDIFKGLRRPPKGILLFGPPGTGKTLIGKCVASQSKSTFFSISASSLTSKWIGDGEKMVRALFAVARCHQPAVIFIDEIDSLLSQRSDTEHESSRRIKTEFLVQLDGATTDNEERLLLIGATNRPQELDEAARRRFVKRLYIPLPDSQARLQLVSKLMDQEQHSLKEEDFQEVSKKCDGYSGADVKNLCSEACLGPIRCIDMNLIQSIQATEVRPVNMEDFLKALNRVKSSVSPDDLNQYSVWNKTYGSGSSF